MWLVPKSQPGASPESRPVDHAVEAALVRWWTGEGTEDDERQGIQLVHEARAHGEWIACHCLGTEARPPIMSPAYLSLVGTYYLRRLHGSNRTEHDSGCPFYCEQIIRAGDQAVQAASAVSASKGFFAVLQLKRELLAQAPTGERPERPQRDPPPPRLARLLWSLIDKAGNNIIDEIGADDEPGIGLEYRRLKAACGAIEIAPGQLLKRHLYTHPDDYHSRLIFARMRDAAEHWPAGHAPQSFLIVFAPRVTSRQIIFKNSDPINLDSDIVKPPIRLVDGGPYLVIAAIGEREHNRGLAAIRAYAQPVYSARHFCPIFRSAEIPFIRSLLDVQDRLDRKGIALSLHKPLFDIEVASGHYRPTIRAALRQHAEDRPHVFNIYLPDDHERDDAAWLDAMASAGEVGSVMSLTAADASDPYAIRTRIEAAMARSQRGATHSAATQSSGKTGDRL